MLMLMLMLLSLPPCSAAVRSQERSRALLFRSGSAPKIKSLGRSTTFLSAVVVAQHVRNLGPGCVLTDIWPVGFVFPRGTVVSVSQKRWPTRLVPDARGLSPCRLACCTRVSHRARLAPWAGSESIGPQRFVTFPQVLNRNPLVPRLSFVLKHVDDMSSDGSATLRARALLPRWIEAAARGGRSLLRQGTHAMSPCGGA